MKKQKKVAHIILIAVILFLTPSLGQAAQAPAGNAPFLHDLKMGSTGEDVKRLQEFLNTNNFPVAKSGPGSARLETTYFGSSTKRALMLFQQHFAEEILKPLNLTRATGNFFSSTRNYINSLSLNAAIEPSVQENAEPQTVYRAPDKQYVGGGTIFGRSQYTVTSSGDGHETSSPSTPQTVDYDTTQSFTVTADVGYTLSPTVGGSCPGGTWSGSTYTTGAITATCSVSFSASITTFTIVPSADANGSISPSSPQTVDYGDNVTFTATPNSGYSVSGWTLDGSSYDACGTNTTCEVTNVTANHTIAVTFDGVLSATVTPSSLSVYTNQTASFTASPTGGVSPYSYQWYSCTDSTCVSTTAILDAISSTYTPPTDTAGTYYYQAVVTDSASSPETATTNVATLAVNSLPHIIFATTNTYTGNLGGLSGADQKCNLDPGKPGGFALDYNYKALLNGNNATISGTPYYRTDGITLIATATGGNLVGLSSLVNSIEASGSLTAWTGANGNNSSNWTSTTTNGDRGAVSSSTSQYWYAGTSTGSTARALYCASQ